MSNVNIVGRHENMYIIQALLFLSMPVPGDTSENNLRKVTDRQIVFDLGDN